MIKSSPITLETIKQWALYSVLGIVVAAALVYVGDWAVLHVRAARGTAFGSVNVEHFMITPLKGGKAEYDYLGNEDATCSRSLFPQMGYEPCWYLRRHSSQDQLN